MTVTGIITRLEKIRKQNFQTFNQIASEYHSHRRSPWIECISPLIKLAQNSVILDIGAGTGRQTIAIARQQMNVIAVDFAVNMLKQLDREVANLGLNVRVSIVAADIITQPFRDEVFDGIEMVAALHHIPSRRLRASALREIFRVTRRGGKIMVSVWFRNQRGFLRPLIVSACNAMLRRSEWGDVSVPWNNRPRFYHLFTKRELESLFSMSGFRTERIGVKIFGPDDASRINANILLEASKI